MIIYVYDLNLTDSLMNKSRMGRELYILLQLQDI